MVNNVGVYPTMIPGEHVLQVETLVQYAQLEMQGLQTLSLVR